MRKFAVLLFLALGCSQDESSDFTCTLSKIISTTSNSRTETTYSYNSEGKVSRQTRISNGVTTFDYTYFYGTDGKVVKVEDIDEISQSEYDASGRLKTVIESTLDGIEKQRFSYEWLDGKVRITLFQMGKPNPIQVNEVEFLNENIVRDVIQSFTGNDPNVLMSISDTKYEDFDSALSAFYIVSRARPGYNPIISKNNPRKSTSSQQSFVNGVLASESNSITNYSYQYNSSNATIRSTSTTGSFTVTTEIIYENCN